MSRLAKADWLKNCPLCMTKSNIENWIRRYKYRANSIRLCFDFGSHHFRARSIHPFKVGAHLHWSEYWSTIITMAQFSLLCCAEVRNNLKRLDIIKFHDYQLAAVFTDFSCTFTKYKLATPGYAHSTVNTRLHSQALKNFKETACQHGRWKLNDKTGMNGKKECPKWYIKCIITTYRA